MSSAAPRFVVGAVLLLLAVNEWRLSRLRATWTTRDTMRLVIPGATLTVLGFQTVLSSFFVSILGLRRL